MAGRYKLTPLLTEGEERVLLAMLEGHVTGKDLAAHLNIHHGTVRSHLISMRRKTHTKNMTALILWAWAAGYPAPTEESCTTLLDSMNQEESS
jgi:DNA-binding CsgD family transcriptional regulator